MSTPFTTRISISTPAGSDLIAGWLRRARGHAEGSRWILRGGVLTAALCRGARVPADVDYLLLGVFDEPALRAALAEIAALPDGATSLELDAVEGIWTDTAFPGLRAFVSGQSERGADRFQVDLGFGDPLSIPPRPTVIAGVGSVLSCAPETLFGWKAHGLVEFGRGQWRAKDLFDLDLLWREVALDRDALRAALELAFSSRSLPLSALEDFLTRPSWGASRSGERKWRTFARRNAGVPPFLEVRERVKAALTEVLGRA